MNICISSLQIEKEEYQYLFSLFLSHNFDAIRKQTTEHSIVLSVAVADGISD